VKYSAVKKCQNRTIQYINYQLDALIIIYS